MFTRLLLCSLALLFTTSPLFAQWDWVDNSVSGNFEGVTDIAVDDVRDVIYSVGYFDGAANFPEIGLSHGSEDGFVMKYDLAGNVIWGFAIGGSGDDRINGVAVDEATGNIFITGFIEGSFASNATSLQGTLGGVPSNVTSVAGGQDAFVSCYNLLGQLIWKKIIGGSDVDGGMDITVNVGGVYATGFYSNTAGLSSITSIIPTNGVINHFVIALNVSNGNTLWDAVLGSSVDDYDIPSLNSTIRRTGISSDASNVYVVTYFNGTAYNVYNGYDALSTTIADPNSSAQDFVATSYSNTGSHIWSVLYDNVGSVAAGIDVTSDCSGVYVSGSLHDNSTTPGGVTINSDHDNFFISKLNKTSGAEIWLKEFESEYDHDDYFVGIDADGFGNLYAVGRLRGTDVGLGTDLNYSSGQSHSQVMIAHFHTDGTFQSFEVIPSSGYSWGMSIACYKDEKYVIGGFYNNTITFGPYSPNPNSNNAFLATRSLPVSFEYVSASGNNVFCQSEGNPTPILNLPTGGTFSGPAQVVFENITTGKVDLTSSIPGGPYTITYSGYPLACAAVSVDFQIYIAIDDASFTYATDHFCNNEPNPIPTSIATPGGTFTAPLGLILANTSTGEIDVTASTVGGPYYLVYSTNGVNCPVSDSIQVYIDSAPDPSFSYVQSSFCTGSDPILPNSVALPGGTFSGPTEIVFVNTTTGEIDINASSVGGPYTIQYLVSNTYCQDSTTFNLTINPLEDASFSYSTDHFCSNEPNPIPTSITTSGGTFTAPSGLVLANNSTGEIDAAASTVGGPYYLVYSTSGVNCPVSDSIQVYIDVVPDASFAYGAASFCSGSGIILPSSVTLPGGTFSGPVEIVFTNTTTGEIDVAASTIGGPYTIQYFASNMYCQDSTTFNLSINPSDDASFAYSASHFCYNEANPLPTSITTPGGTFTAPLGLVLASTSTGEIDVVASTIGGPYYLVYTTNGLNCAESDSIQVYIESSPNPSFSYEQSTFCIQSGTITPNSVIVPGGTFSGPSEIVFVNATTGEIDINASTIGGPYSIEYLVSNTYCQKSTTFDITIIGQDDLVSVDYSASEYCVSDVNQIPVINGVSGGVFSGAASIDIVNSTTGEFSPSTSSPGGPYLMKYVTLGTCPDSVELFLTIYDVPSVADAGKDQELFFTLTSTLEADLPIIGNGEWSTLSSGLIADEFDPNSDVSNLSIGINTFTWTVTNGACPSVSDEISIVIHDLFIPQAVTPNGDGKNDFFELYSIDGVTCSLQIYNRWGQVIYENSDYENEWYGQSSKGVELENDTYFYVILIDDSISFNGYVVLKK